ncbi:MAG: cysteine desulfurase family protein, partial [Bacteroidia bacterium]
VFEAMKPYFCGFHGNPSSTHAEGRILRTAIENARKTVAKYLNAAPAEIFFTSGGTEADNAIILGTVAAHGVKHIVSTTIEHHAVTHTVECLEKEGKVSVTYLTLDKEGNIDLNELEQVLANAPKTLVSLMHANNEIGTMHNLEAIGEICEKYHALFHSDTVQTIGNMPFDLQKLKVHYITGAAHKFYGPKGIGFFYVRAGAAVPPLIHGGSQERNMRAGTENVAGIVGMGVAMEKCYNTLQEKHEKLWALKNYMKTELEKHFPFVTFNGSLSPENSIPTVLNAAFGEDEDSMLTVMLDMYGISASGGSACTSGSNLGSHVLRGIGVDPKKAANAVRFSFGVQNTKEEIDTTIEKLKEILKVTA